MNKPTWVLALTVVLAAGVAPAHAGMEKVEPALQAELNTLPPGATRPVIVQYYNPVQTQVVRNRRSGPSAHTQSLLGGVVGGLVTVVGGLVGTVLGLLNAVVANLTA